MLCSDRDLNTLRDIGVLDLDGSPNEEGTRELCRGLKDSVAEGERECIECVEQYRTVLRSPDPLFTLVTEVFGVSRECAEYVSKVLGLGRVCREAASGW